MLFGCFALLNEKQTISSLGLVHVTHIWFSMKWPIKLKKKEYRRKGSIVTDYQKVITVHVTFRRSLTIFTIFFRLKHPFSHHFCDTLGVITAIIPGGLTDITLLQILLFKDLI